MAVTNSIAKLVSTKVMKTLENNLIAKKICTMETGSEIKKMGDTVYFTGLADPTVNPYSGTITYETLTDSTINLVIDQKDYVAFDIDDIEAFQSSIDIKGTQVERAGYKLRDKADKYILGLYASANTTVTATVTSVIALSTVAEVIENLKEANVPANQMWMVITPWMEQKLILAGIKFQINNGIDGNGDGLEFAKYQGMDIYVSNNVTLASGSKGSRVHEMLAGSYNAIVYADQMMKSRFIAEKENTFAGGYSALHVYGAKVIKPEELVRCTFTETVETTI